MARKRKRRRKSKPELKAPDPASHKEVNIAVGNTHGCAKAVVLPEERSSGTVRENIPKFEIFINHRGPDIKESFVSHLADALRAKGYTPFVDKDGIRKGENCSEEIQAALEGASIQLAIFTPRYAESKYCLNELVDMLGCCDKDTEKVNLIPVFFKVEPRHLRKPDEGHFRKAFLKHEEKALALKDEHHRVAMQEKIKSWKHALFQSAGLLDFELMDDLCRDENEFMHKVINDIESKLASGIFRKQPIPHPSVGIETPFIHIEGELEKLKGLVTILGIWGMGGIGKTTLAKELYNRCTEKYEFYTFLEMGGSKSMEELQKQVLYDILGQKEENIREKYNGWFKKLGRHRVLLVIDNISKEGEFSQLVPNIESLGIGSRVIVTSRDQHVWKSIIRDRNSSYLHKMQVLDLDASLQLFGSHAFESNICLALYTGLHDLADQIVNRCGGLPLALVIIGKHLYQREKVVWEEVVESMETRSEVLGVLSISYWGLSESEKMMFLDVSCQMIGMLEEDAIVIWKSCGLGRKLGGCRPPQCWTSRRVMESLGILKDKALVTVDSEKKLTMHDLLQDMGKWVVGRDSIGGGLRELENHSHLWNFEDARLVLEKAKGTEKIRGLSLATCLDVFEKDRGITTSIDASKFKNMDAIHLLELDFARIEGDFSEWSSSIRWLKWRYSPLTKLPPKLQFPFLIHLDLSCSLNLTGLWSADDDTQVPRFLRVLNLENCWSLEVISENINLLTKLKRFNLQSCRSLKSLPSSWGQLIELEELNLKHCGALESLPSDIVNLSSLKVFTMSYCSSITTLPEDFGKLTALVNLSFDGCKELRQLVDSFSSLSLLNKLSLCGSGLVELPGTFGDLGQLVELDMQLCDHLRSLPESFGKLKCLEVLDLVGCSNLRRLCTNFGQLSSLTKLNLTCPITDDDFPSSFGGLCSLKTFQMQETHLTRLPKNFNSLTALVVLDLSQSQDLAKIGPLPVMLEVLDLSYCPCLVTVRGLEHMQALEEIDLSRCPRLEDIYNGIISNPNLKRCFLDENNLSYLKYIKNWSEDGPSTQVVFIETIDDDSLEKDKDDEELLCIKDDDEDPSSNDEEEEDSSSNDGEEEEDPSSNDEDEDESHFETRPTIPSFKKCMEMTISEEKRVNGVIIILRSTGDCEGMYICNVQARILRSGEVVHSSLIFSRAEYGEKVLYQLPIVMIGTIRRSHPLVRQLRYGDILSVYTESFHLKHLVRRKIVVAYDTKHDLDDLNMIDVYRLVKINANDELEAYQEDMMMDL